MKFRNSKCETRNGFALLEVVVAMSIVALGVVTLFEIFSLGLRLGARSFERTEATARGRQAIDEFLVQGEVKEGERGGSFDERYRWKIQVRPFQDDAQFFSTGWDLSEVTLQLQYREGAREKELELKTLRLAKKKDS